MTNDDREEARHGEGDPSEPRRGRPSSGLGPRLSGLLDGLPESGKGAQGAPGVPAPQGEEPRSVPGNPFRRPLQEPAAPTRQVRPAAPPAPPRDVTPEPEPAPEPEPEPAPEPAPTRAPDTARDPRPNVIPFRGGPHPATRSQAPLAPEAGSAREREEVAQEPPPAQASTEPDTVTNPGHADQVPAAAEQAEQSDTVHAYEAAASFPEPQHTGPPRAGEPAGDPRGRPAPAPEAPADDAWRHTGHDFDAAERAAVYRAIRERRDV